MLVPTFVTLVDAGNDDEADRLANGLLGYALAVMGVITALGIAFAPLLARLLSSGAPNAHVGAEQRHLATFLLWFFLPQVMLYAFGAIATGLLYATPVRDHGGRADRQQRRDDRLLHRVPGARRPKPGVRPDDHREGAARRRRDRGVVAFVGILVVAAPGGLLAHGRAGPRRSRARALLRLAVWGVALHSGAAMLLGASLVAGNGVAGGVVAYQVAFVFFLAPYAVLAQPIITTILPQMSNTAVAATSTRSRDRFAGRSIGRRCS